MKVLFITSWYPAEQNPTFGIFIKEHALAVRSLGVELVVFSVILEKKSVFLKINTIDFTDEYGIRNIRLTISGRLKDYLYYLPFIQNIFFKKTYKKHLKNTFTPDLIHSHVVFPAGIFGNSLAKKLKKPHIITEHWSKLPSVLSKPILKIKIKNAYEQAAKIFPVSLFLRNYILNLFPELNTDKFAVIPNVVNANTFFYKEKIRDGNTLHFTAAATWATKRQPDKNPELFIEALAALQQKVPQKIRLTMVGGGDRIEELKKLCEKKQLTAAFKGYLPKQEIAAILHKSDFFVHASLIETFGIVVAEALLTGTPVICSEVGALPEMINETNGVLCKNTVEEWENAIQKAINTNFNLEKISETINNQLSQTSVANKINMVYRGVLD